MRTDEGFLEWLRELLEPLGKVSVRRMFGGHGVYVDGLFVAIVDEGRAWFKADAETEADFAAAGCSPFVFEARGREVASSYWSLPESALDSAEEMEPWARKAIAAALRKPAVKAAKRASRRKATGGRSGPSASRPRS